MVIENSHVRKAFYDALDAAILVAQRAPSGHTMPDVRSLLAVRVERFTRALGDPGSWLLTALSNGFGIEILQSLFASSAAPIPFYVTAVFLRSLSRASGLRLPLLLPLCRHELPAGLIDAVLKQDTRIISCVSNLEFLSRRLRPCHNALTHLTTDAFYSPAHFQSGFDDGAGDRVEDIDFYMRIAKARRILEVGGGSGRLTSTIAEHARDVTVVERDAEAPCFNLIASRMVYGDLRAVASRLRRQFDAVLLPFNVCRYPMSLQSLHQLVGVAISCLAPNGIVAGDIEIPDSAIGHATTEGFESIIVRGRDVAIDWKLSVGLAKLERTFADHGMDVRFQSERVESPVWCGTIVFFTAARATT